MALSVHARLMRAQAMRCTRNSTAGAAEPDAWTRHVADRSSLEVADLEAARYAAASFGAVRVARRHGPKRRLRPVWIQELRKMYHL